MAGSGKYCYRNVLPFSGLVTMECINVGLNTLFKAASTGGMSYHVFIVYAYAIAALLLLPSPFFSYRSRTLPPLTRSIMCKIGLLGIIGSTSQMMGYTGISYSSPTLASAISNLTPAFTFILAIIFRMEKVTLKRTSSQAKILGTIISIAGAFVVTLYKGPTIINSTSTSTSTALLRQQQPLLRSPDSNWIVGGLFLSCEYLLNPLWYIVVVQVLKEYPNELTVVFFYNLCVSIIAAVVCFFTEGTSSAWRLRTDIAILSVVCSGLFGSCISNTVHSWALHLKGPLYVAMFKPLSIAIAVAMGVLFLGDSLYLGSLIGATIISIGFYTVMWGKSKEDMVEDYQVGDTPPSSEKAPLLQPHTAENV